MTRVLTSHKQDYDYSAMAVSPEHTEDNVFASTGGKASNFGKMRTRAYHGLQYTGRKTKRYWISIYTVYYSCLASSWVFYIIIIKTIYRRKIDMCLLYFYTYYRGLEWLFGIQPAEEGDRHRLKWEARQRRLRRLRTDKQPILRSRPTSPMAIVTPVPEGLPSRYSRCYSMYVITC